MQIDKAHLKFRSNYNPAKIEQIKILKEEEYQDGFIKVPVSGVYTLYSESNDGSLLYLDGKLIVDNDLHHKVQEGFSKTALKVGWHSIKLKYFQMGGDKALRVSWKGPRFNKQEIPSSVLFH